MVCQGAAGVGKLRGRQKEEPEAFQSWTVANPEEAATRPIVKTGNGHHVYFFSRGRKITFHEDGETRCAGINLLPPSIHPNGSVYAWLVPLEAVELAERTPVEPTSIQAIHCMCASLDNEVPDGQKEAMIEAAIWRTLPTAPGTRNQRIFYFAKELKAIMPDATPKELKVEVQKWHTMALPMIRTKQFQETWNDFRVAWQKCRPSRVMVFKKVKAEAMMAPMPDYALEYEDDVMRDLIRLCVALQRYHGRKSFPLGSHKVAEELGCCPHKASDLLKILTFEKFLKLTKRDNWGKNQAREYRVIMDISDDSSE